MTLRSFFTGFWLMTLSFFLTISTLYSQGRRDSDLYNDGRNKISIAKKGTFGRVQLGGSFLDLESINLALENLEYDPINSNYFAMGLGLSRFSGKWIANADIYNYMIKESAFNNQLAILSFHYLTTSLGYIAFRQENDFFIYPAIGVGGGITNLKIRKGDERYHTAFFTAGTLVDASLNLRYFSDIEDGKGNSIEIGLSVGYMRQLDNQFKFRKLVPDQTVTASPSGPYFRLSFGMGRMK